MARGAQNRIYIHTIVWIALRIALNHVTATVTITTRLGNLTGVYRNMVSGTTNMGRMNYFYDIPYGKAPVGSRRFKKAELFGPWPYPWNATQSKYSCYPGLVFPEVVEFLQETEDCLHLDVYVPGSVGREGRKAVLILVHNSGLVFGSKIFHTADWLSKNGDVIVVVPNYRLGIHGLFTTMDDHAPGNLPLWDIQLAIQWVHENIEDFGGDKDRVTLMGGVGSIDIVSAQALYPGNMGLLNRVILMSGSPLMKTVYIRDPMDFSLMFLEHIGCGRYTMATLDSQSAVTCLQGKSNDELKHGMNSLMQNTSAQPDVSLTPGFSLYIDGDFIKRDPAESLRDVTSSEFRMFRSLDVLVGCTDEEGSILPGFVTLADQGAAHGTAEFFLLDLFSSISKHEDEIKVATDAMKMWASFVKNGNPSTDKHNWKPFVTGSAEYYTVMADSFSNAKDLYPKRMKLWLQTIPAIQCHASTGCDVMTTMAASDLGSDPNTAATPVSSLLFILIWAGLAVI